jgi:hypothetical protein
MKRPLPSAAQSSASPDVAECGEEFSAIDYGIRTASAESCQLNRPRPGWPRLNRGDRGRLRSGCALFEQARPRQARLAGSNPGQDLTLI